MAFVPGAERWTYSHVLQPSSTPNRYFWAIECDIRQCFDCIHHRKLLQLIELRIKDARIVKLIRCFLQAGEMENALFQKTAEGTPQGGILSPLLANIYLHQLDLWWRRLFRAIPNKERQRRRHKLGNAILVRYADDCVILWSGTHQLAKALRYDLKHFFWHELHLELSEEKTHISHMTDGIDFLGFHLRWMPTHNQERPWLQVTPTQKNLKRFRAKVKTLTGRDNNLLSHESLMQQVNRLIRGRSCYYRYVNYGHHSSKLDYWINERVFKWLKHKHQGKRVPWILKQFKRRELKGHHNRWNLAVPAETTGQVIFITVLSDIPIKRYYPKKPGHPYLMNAEIPLAAEPESPLIATRAYALTQSVREWRTLRAKVFKRDGYACVHCGIIGVPLEAHHVIPLKDGGEHRMANLQRLCHTCHTQTPSNREPLSS